ncbi:Aste57867_22736 [Aphanomyces stellatus]|uniref:Aste57867_22736 protein n=1 Tax=Aphanomyces stellatus TaxID=120398 RepID=A0A485LL05_9STRA|nr:hypothetical protein As57867_022666 [Aphanomyces stellatus]VFT99389.1 Aste57867_22736 [Aphanomyces stellatus]
MPSPSQHASCAPAASTGTASNLSSIERRRVYDTLLALTVGGRLPYGAISNTAKQFGCHRTTVSKLWARARRSLLRGALVADIDAKKRGNSGRPRRRSPDAIEAAIRAVPHEDRQTMRSLAAQSGIPKTLVIRHMQETKRLKGRSSYVKPALMDANKIERVTFALGFLRPRPHGSHFFDDMYNRVHVDEKWFFLTKVKRTFYVYEDEELAHRAAKSKRFITKVMFLAAVARPRYDHHLKCTFDGKLGIWPFVQRIPAARNSKNRPRGTLITTPVNVDAKVYADCVFNNVVPAIKDMFPRACLQRGVLIQQDNASPHRVVSSAMLGANGVDSIGVANQPPKSPDCNVLDLGYFNAIQSLQHQKRTRTIDDLIDAVERSFVECQ